MGKRRNAVESVVLEQMRKRFQEWLDLDFSLKEVELPYCLGEKKLSSKAVKIQILPLREQSNGVITDLDDTLRVTSLLKYFFSDELEKLYIPKKLAQEIEKKKLSQKYTAEFRAAYLRVNDQARILHHSTLAEVYIPLLELHLLMKFKIELARCDSLNDLDLLLSNWNKSSNVQKKLEEVLQSLSPEMLRIAKRTKKTEDQFFSADPDIWQPNFFSQEPPKGIEKQLWELYKQFHVAANVEAEEYLFKVHKDTNWILITCGEKNFTFAKVIHFLNFLRTAHFRLPNQIIVVFRGQKLPFVEEYVKKYHGPKDTLVLLHVRREGAKRNGVILEGFRQIAFPDCQMSLQELLELEQQKYGADGITTVVFDDNVRGELEPMKRVLKVA